MSLQPTYAEGMRTRCVDWLSKTARTSTVVISWSGRNSSDAMSTSWQVSDTAAAMQISASDSSEVGFNMACALLQLGSFAEAEQQLQLALRAGMPQ